MRRVIALACVLASCGMGVARGADGALVWSYRYVLATSTVDTQLLPIVSGITTDSSVRDQATCDLLAEVLLRLKAEGISAKLTEVQIVRVLTNVPIAARYHDVLTKLAPSITDKGAKIQLTQYRREFPRTKGEQYVRGTIDLDALRRGFVEAALAAKPTMAQAQALADLPTNATMDEMFAIAGKPALVMSRDVRVADLISIEVRQLWFYYRGVGRVTYDYQHDSGWHAHGFVADPMAFESSMPYRTKATELGMPDDATLSMIQLERHCRFHQTLRPVQLPPRRSATGIPRYRGGAAAAELRGNRQHRGERRLRLDLQCP